MFGTEEALVEPMLLALDTTEPFLTVSAKKPAEQDGIYITLQDKEQMKTLPSSTASSGTGEDDRKLTGVKVAEGTVCLQSHRQAAAKEGERTNSQKLEAHKENCAGQNTPTIERLLACLIKSQLPLCFDLIWNMQEVQ